MKQGCEYWRRHVEAWRRGGQSKKAYCEQHDLAYWSMCRWAGRLSEGESPERQQLVELEPVGGLSQEAPARAAIELVVGERYVLRLWASVRAAHLREVLAALEGVR